MKCSSCGVKLNFANAIRIGNRIVCRESTECTSRQIERRQNERQQTAVTPNVIPFKHPRIKYGETDRD